MVVAVATGNSAEAIPGTGIPQGNPPSGVASGDVWFDIVALAVAPRLLAAWERVSSRPLEPLPDAR